MYFHPRSHLSEMGLYEPSKSNVLNRKIRWFAKSVKKNENNYASRELEPGIGNKFLKYPFYPKSESGS